MVDGQSRAEVDRIAVLEAQDLASEARDVVDDQRVAVGGIEERVGLADRARGLDRARAADLHDGIAGDLATRLEGERAAAHEGRAADLTAGRNDKRSAIRYHGVDCDTAGRDGQQATPGSVTRSSISMTPDEMTSVAPPLTIRPAMPVPPTPACTVIEACSPPSQTDVSFVHEPASEIDVYVKGR